MFRKGTEKNLGNSLVCTKANPIGITKRLMRMIIYEAFRGLYELTVYVSKTNKGQTRPTQTAPPPPKKYLATQVASSFPASFLAHTPCFFVFSTFNCKNSRLFSAHSLKLFFCFLAKLWIQRKHFLCVIIYVAVGQYALSLKCGKIQMLLLCLFYTLWQT